MAIHFGSTCFDVNQAPSMNLSKLVQLNEEPAGQRIDKIAESIFIPSEELRVSDWSPPRVEFTPEGISPFLRLPLPYPNSLTLLPPPMTTDLVLQPSSCQLPGGRSYFLQVSTFLCQKPELVAIETALYRRGGRGKKKISLLHCLTWVLSVFYVCVCVRVCVWQRPYE